MSIEDRIRSRIEAILMNDARNYAHMRQMALEGEEFGDNALESEERNLYQRIINNYRNAVSQANRLLEENVGFLSIFFRIVESIKETFQFQEICTRIADSALEDFGAEYCSILLQEAPGEEDPFCLEGACEDQKVLRIHSGRNLLGSEEFANALQKIAARSSECLRVDDVYRDARFNAVDFPSIVRSLLCLPITRQRHSIGLMVLGHSLPNFFTDNHLRVLKILASMISHLYMLTQGRPGERIQEAAEPASNGADQSGEVFSVAQLAFERTDAFGRTNPLDRGALRVIRRQLLRSVAGCDSILYNGDGELLVIMPDVGREQLPSRVCALRDVFFRWREEQKGPLSGARMIFGFASCEEGDDLPRTLEMATLFMHPETDAELDRAAER